MLWQKPREMGKKNKKKGNSAEKTAIKTEKNLASKQKKELVALGEEDIEKIIERIEQETKQRSKVTEHDVGPPSRRINFSFVPHPDKDELIMYGGECFNGQKTLIYDDLFFYNIANDTWTLLKTPNAPPPRCGQQLCTSSANNGELWVFGGEYISPSQSQFYHYRDLWVFNLKEKQWTKVKAPNSPSGRSGHRMVYSKKKLFIFGGFHDNARDYRYYNDIHCFDTETYKWVPLEVKGNPPTPRSGCCMVALPDGKILVSGGYSKEKSKKDADKGNTYSDAFLLVPDKNDTTDTKYKWTTLKIGGVHFSPRCGMSIAINRNNAYLFGGVFDVDENDEELSSNFYDGLYSLDLEKLLWRDVVVVGKKEKELKSRRRRTSSSSEDNYPTSKSEEQMAATEPLTLADDGVFKVTVSSGATIIATCSTMPTTRPKINWPRPRMNAGLAIKNNVLFLFGGMFEDGDKEVTLADFYALDLKKLEEWKILRNDDLSKVEWIEDESESESSDSESNDSKDEVQGGPTFSDVN